MDDRDSSRPWAEHYENESKSSKKSGVESLQFLNSEDSDHESEGKRKHKNKMYGPRDQSRILAEMKEVEIPESKSSIPPLMPEPSNVYEDRVGPYQGQHARTSNVDMVEKPNFESNILDYRSHYQIRNPMVPDVPKYAAEGDASSLPKLSQKGTPTPFPAADNGKNFGRPSKNLPDRWEYANELAMNGGLFGGRFHGVDSTESLYAPYQAGSASLSKCGKEAVARIPHNDLRKPIVYN